MNTNHVDHIYNPEASFQNQGNLNTHIRSDHVQMCPTPYLSCNSSFSILNLSKDHTFNNHGVPGLHECNLCGFTTSSSTTLKHHQESSHVHQPSIIHCNVCGQAFSHMRDLNMHAREHHESLSPSDRSGTNTVPQIEPTCYTPALFSPIDQVDGNVSPPSLSSTPGLPKRDIADHAIISAGGSNTSFIPSPHFQYTLNSVNQTKRLLENTNRDAFTIRYNAPQIFKGRQLPTNVSVDCNTGAYLSAVKPALEAITCGWQTEILSTVITCEDKIDRTEMSGRKVSTKLVLYLTENSVPSVKCKVVLHFYHTSSTLQAQGSSLLTSGMTSPVWLIKNFLEPLATAHVNRNKETIAQINSNIVEASLICKHCNEKINPAASRPKDQELTCSKCGQLYHKRCTDRNRTTANWKKTPWYCQPCMLGHQPVSQHDPLHQKAVQPSHANLSQSPGHSQSPSAQIVQSHSQLHDQLQAASHSVSLLQHQSPPALQSHSLPALQHQPHLAIPVEEQLGTACPADHEQLELNLNDSNSGLLLLPADLPPVQPQADSQTLPSIPSRSGPTPDPSQVKTTTKYPNNSIRQRSSNIVVNDPEREFLKTALDSCRGTIAQQESEIKRLNECLEIRNQRIMQLDGQVNFAATEAASRETCSHKDSSFTKTNEVHESLNLLISKLNSMTSFSPPCININNNTSCKNSSSPLTCNVSAQTEDSLVRCNLCDKQDESYPHLHKHTENNMESESLCNTSGAPSLPCESPSPAQDVVESPGNSL